MLAASFFSLTVLVTLIAVAMVMRLIIGCKLYYQRKIWRAGSRRAASARRDCWAAESARGWLQAGRDVVPAF